MRRAELFVGVVSVWAVAFGGARADGGDERRTTSESERRASREVAVGDGKTAVARVRIAKEHVRTLVENAARSTSSRLQQQCVTDKLNQLKALEAAAARRAVALDAAAAKHADARARHEQQALETIRRRAETLDSEAQQCWGSDDDDDVDTFGPSLSIVRFADLNDARELPGDADGSATLGGGNDEPTFPPLNASATR